MPEMKSFDLSRNENLDKTTITKNTISSSNKLYFNELVLLLKITTSLYSHIYRKTKYEPKWRMKITRMFNVYK
jgi:hypothetical protein